MFLHNMSAMSILHLSRSCYARTFRTAHKTNLVCQCVSVASHTLPGARSLSSRQLQCEVPCGIGNVINPSLFINSSLSSLSSTSHAVHKGGPTSKGVLPPAGGEGGPMGGGGQGTFQSSCHILHYHTVLCPKGTSHNHEGPRQTQTREDL